MIKQWKTLSSKILLETSILRVEQKTALNPRNNHECELTTTHFPNWVNVIALTETNELVLVRQFRHGTEKVEIEIPGGCIDDTDTDPVEAGVRELLEETGYTGENARLIGKTSPNPAIQGNTCYAVLVENAKCVGDQNLDHGEDIEVFTASLDKIHQMVAEGEISHSLVVSALYFYEKGLS